MASSDFTGIPEHGTTFLFASWLYVADGLGGFTSHLASPKDLEANTTILNDSIDDQLKKPEE